MSFELRSLRWAHVILWGLVALVAIALFASLARAATPPPVFDAPSISCAENAGTCAFTINKSAKAASYSQLRVQTVDGSAKAGVDYAAVNKVVTIGNNVLHVTVPIAILNNSTFEGSRTFAVRLTIVRYGQLAGSFAPPTVTINDDEIAPAPPPPPAPAPSGLAGEAAVSDGLNPAEWLELGEAPHASPDEVGAFRFTCLAGQLLRDDPIVYPGQAGKSHLHQFFGNTAANASSNYQSLRTTGGSTCTRSAGISPQRSAYWMPAMLDGAGNAVKPDWLNTYYKQLPASDPNCAVTLDPAVKGKCVPMPNGMKFLVGYDMKSMTGGPADTSSRDYWAMGFDCMTSDGTNVSLTGFKHSIKEIVDSGQCPIGAWLRSAVAFPQCWDGKNIDSADHRSHIMLPPQAICPGDHPYRVPEIAVSAFFRVDANFLAGLWRLSSDDALAAMLGKPVISGTTLHMDYWEAWNVIFKMLWQTNCIDGHLTCSAGNVGDGREIKGMQQVGPFPVHVLVPLSSIP